MLQISNHPLYKRHNLDSAMSSFWEFYKGNFLYLFFVSFVMSLISKYVSTFMDMEKLQSITTDLQVLTDPTVIVEKLKVFMVPMLIFTIVGLFLSCILHYLILVRPLEKENVFVSVFKSLKYFIPYLIILIILGFAGSFALVLGLLMLVVGVFFAMLYIMMISFFILPVLMSEGNNIGNAIVRTAKLSHRNFWSNIGWSAVFIILMIIVSLVLSNIILLPFAGSFMKSIINPEDAGKLAVDLVTNPFYFVLSSIVGAVIMPLMPIFGFIIYFNGRAREEVVQPPSYGDDTYKVRVEDLYARPVHEDKDDEQS
jgi:hypothetical protein